MSAPRDYPELPGAALSRPFLVALLVALVLFALVLLIPRPGLVKLNVPPTDLPWFGTGLNSVFVLKDGTWIVTRSAYLDRRQRYEISPQGTLQTFSDRGSFRIGIAEDVSGGFSPGARTTLLGSAISIKPGQPYRAWLFTLRNKGDYHFLNDIPPDDPPLPQTVDGKTVPLAAAAKPDPMPGTTDPPMIKDWALRSPKEGFGINLNQHNRIEQFVILKGHWFYDISDNMAFVEPYLFLTADRQRTLYRLRFSEPAAGHAELTIDRGVKLNIPVDTENACRLGLDPRRQELFLVRADGSRYWFDPDSLEQTGEDQLPGEWEREYAQVSLHPGEFSPYFGLPLSHGGYERLMRLSMLALLASLLGLSLLWRPGWKSAKMEA